MKYNYKFFVLLSLVALASLMLSACGAAATPAPTMVPTAVPPTDAPTSMPAGSTSLVVTGLVDKPLSLSEADLRAMTVATVTADQPKVGSQSFSGVHFSDLMTAASVQSTAVSLVMTGSDGYSATIDLPTLKACTDCMVAFVGSPVTFLSVMPNQPGKVWVQNLVKLEFK